MQFHNWFPSKVTTSYIITRISTTSILRSLKKLQETECFVSFVTFIFILYIPHEIPRASWFVFHISLFWNTIPKNNFPLYFQENAVRGMADKTAMILCLLVSGTAWCRRPEPWLQPVGAIVSWNLEKFATLLKSCSPRAAVDESL